jgi:hypothetical protein
LTLLTSDSLKATVIVMVLVLTISANGELEPVEVEEDEVPEPPRPPALAPAALPVEGLDDDPVLDVEDAEAEALEVAPADTESPGERLASDTIVPLIGAWSSVAESAVLALLTLASALYTAACAEATLPAEDVVLLELPAPLVPLPAEPEPPEPDPPEPPPPDGAAAELLGAVVAGGALVVGFVVVVV